MAQIGYDHKDTGETFYIKYPFKTYPSLISKITKQEGINKPLFIKFNHTKSIYSLKYAVKFQNLFYYRVNEERSNSIVQLLNFNLKLLQMNKMIKLVNFDVLPVVSMTMHNESTTLPFNVGVKFGKYQASRVQHFDSTPEFASYDFSKVLKSMLPYYRTCVKISHSDQHNFKVFNKDLEVLYKISGGVNRIHGYEDTFKLSSNVKLYLDLYEEFNKMFRLRISDEIHVKKAFIRNIGSFSGKKFKGKFDAESSICRDYRDHHVLSGFECHSKLLEMNVLNSENVIENGSDFYIQNVSTLRIKDIPYLKDHEVLSRLNPYFSLETIFLPAYKVNPKNMKIDFDLKNSFRFIYTMGLSISLTDYLHIDLAFYTNASKNTKIKKEQLSRFRINLSI